MAIGSSLFVSFTKPWISSCFSNLPLVNLLPPRSFSWTFLSCLSTYQLASISLAAGRSSFIKYPSTIFSFLLSSPTTQAASLRLSACISTNGLAFQHSIFLFLPPRLTTTSRKDEDAGKSPSCAGILS